MSAKRAANVVPISRRAKRKHAAARKSVLLELDARVAQLEVIVARIDKRVTRGAFNRPFQIALVTSLLLHLLAIGLITFKLPHAGRDQKRHA